MCLDEAKIVSKSVTSGSVGDYTSNPIAIVKKSGASVVFQIEQNFVNGQLGWLGVYFEPIDGSATKVCRTAEAVTNKTMTSSYTAKCYNGVALVDVFAYDCSFKNISNAIIPSSCEAWSEGEKTASFHFSIPCDPDPVGSLCDDKECIPSARLVKKSVPSGAYGDTLSNPINILHYGGNMVKFRVEQKWKDGDVSFLSVQYKTSATSTVCQVSEGVNSASSTPEYTAQCTNGYAIIDVYAYDCTFTGIPGTVIVPPTCKAWKGDGKTSHFQYSIPCDMDDETHCVDESSCIPVPSVTSKSVVTGATGDFKSMPVTVLRQGGSTVEFQVQQTWKDGEMGYIAVDYDPVDQLNHETCLSIEAVGKGFRTPALTAVCVNGFAEIDVYGYDCTFKNVPNIDLQVPGSCQPFVDVGKKVHFHFSIPCLCAATPVGLTSGSVVTTNALQCTQDIFEDYESEGQIASWSYGTEYDDVPTFTTFMGRLGLTHPEVSKVFSIPTTSTTVDISFSIYDTTGGALGTDKFMVGIQGSYLDIDLSANGKKFYNDIAVTISQSGGNKYSVAMAVPSKWYSNNGYKLPISFKFLSSQLRYGIDNVRLHANCARTRQLESPVYDEASGIPSDNTGDADLSAMYYCSAVDFPCGNDANMVHVCHYSTQNGYETHCIMESDSEILRFYQKDYCGPCLGSTVA
jgi:hypothetical protein